MHTVRRRHSCRRRRRRCSPGRALHRLCGVRSPTLEPPRDITRPRCRGPCARSPRRACTRAPSVYASTWRWSCCCATARRTVSALKSVAGHRPGPACGPPPCPAAIAEGEGSGTPSGARASAVAQACLLSRRSSQGRVDTCMRLQAEYPRLQAAAGAAALLPEGRVEARPRRVWRRRRDEARQAARGARADDPPCQASQARPFPAAAAAAAAAATAAARCHCCRSLNAPCCVCRRALRRAPPRKRNSLSSIAEGDEEVERLDR